jgi:hypothetical protein
MSLLLYGLLVENQFELLLSTLIMSLLAVIVSFEFVYEMQFRFALALVRSFIHSSQSIQAPT